MREAIVVLGMHRSGTSMVSGILKLTGLDLGKNLWDPDHANAKGYFENSRIGIFNDHLLEMLHANWHDTLSIPDGWWLDEMIIRQSDQFAEIIREEFDASSFLLFKDPRISVLLPFYLRAFDQMNIRPCFIINYRDPFEVAESIRKRDNLATSKSLLLWMDHTLKAELYTRDRPRIFVRYDQVLEDPLSFVNKIFHQFRLENKPTSAQSEQITAFVEKKLKHHSGQNLSSNDHVPALVNRLYDLVCSMDRNVPNDSYTHKFDEIWKDFYSAYRFYHGVDPAFEALLQYETTSGIRKTSAITTHTGFNRLNFVLECDAPVKRMIFSPCNQKTGVILHKVMITDDKNRQFEIHPCHTNAGWNDPDGTLVFESEIPAITYAMASPRILTGMSVELTCIVNAGPTYRFGIHKRDLFIRGLSEKVKESGEKLQKERRESGSLLVQKENELSVILKSWTWKAGKFILSPAQLFLKMIKK